jgi:hypothetical protein
LSGGELVAVNGSKFRVANSRKRNFNPTKPARIIKAIDERIAAYPAEMEKQDRAEPSVAETSVEELRAKIEHLRERPQFHRNLIEELREARDESRILPAAWAEEGGAEMSLTALCYNLKRVLNIVGVEKMVREVV